MDNRVRIQKGEYLYLKRRLKQIIRYKSDSLRGKNIKCFMMSWYTMHLGEITWDTFQGMFNSAVSLGWGNYYLRRRIEYEKFLKKIRRDYIKVIEFKEA